MPGNEEQAAQLLDEFLVAAAASAAGRAEGAALTKADTAAA